MATVNNVLSNLLTNPYASPQGQANTAGADAAEGLISSAYCAVAVAAVDDVGSKYRFFSVKSSDVIHGLSFAGTAQTAGAFSLGLYAPNTGAVASVHLFATSISCASAVPLTEERYTNLALTTAGKRVWELLALSSDPVLNYDVVATSTTASTDGGTIFLRITKSTG